MDSNDIIQLGKSLDDLKTIKKDIQEAKQEKAQIEKNIVILKKANAEEQEIYDEDKKKRKAQISQLDNNIKLLELKRADLATSVIPEIKKMETLKDELAKTSTSLEKREDALATKSETLNKRENKIEDKKDILSQIIELAKKL